MMQTQTAADAGLRPAFRARGERRIASARSAIHMAFVIRFLSRALAREARPPQSSVFLCSSALSALTLFVTRAVSEHSRNTIPLL